MRKPMLAHKFDEKRVDFNQPTYIQPKLDGVRCNIYLNDNKDIVCFSRTGKQFMNLRHIEMSLQSFFKSQPDVVLDGELYNHKLKHNFEKIISLVRKQKPTDEDRINAQHLIQFHCYDYFSQDSHYENYKHRMHQLVASDIYNACIKYVPAKLVDSYGYARTLHQEYLDQGYEGSIIRLNGLYKHGRSYDLMKFKDFSDTEATIIGYETGKGKRTGTIGKFLMQDDDGNKFGCPPGKGYNYKDLANILDNIGDYIGKRATFTYFQRTNAGSYRHPLFKAIRNYE
jgi:ATP-dependent DNA ligase